MTSLNAWMVFVDGENFTIRAQELAKQNGLNLGVDPGNFLRDIFVWIPGWPPLRAPFYTRAFLLENDFGTRAYYYTSAVGDPDRIDSVRRSLRIIGFDPQVFKKPASAIKSKGVDITLTKDMLSHAFLDNYADAVLIAGDGDYVPLIEEVKRRGKRVHVGFFAGEGLGLSEEITLAADFFVDLTEPFVTTWKTRIEALEKGRG